MNTTRKRCSPSKQPFSVVDWARGYEARGGHRHRKCITCANTKLAALCREFAAWKKAGGLSSWADFYAEVVVGRMKLGMSLAAIHRHVRECMGRE